MTETTETTENMELADLAAQNLPEDDDRAKKELTRYTKKRSKKKKWIILAVVVVVGAAGFKLLTPKPAPPPIDTTVLEKQELSNTVSLTGIVESAEATKVYAKTAGMANAVNVKVGDRVEAGDVLCVLDTEDLSLQIASQKATIAQAQRMNQHNLDVSQKKLENAQGNISNGLEASLLNAENSLRSAQQNLSDARIDYNDAKDIRTGADEELTAAEREYDKTKAAKDTIENKLKVEEARPADEQNTALIAELRDQLADAEALYDKANARLNNAQSDTSALSRERTLYRQARVAYENALASKNAIENSVQQELDSIQDSVKGTELAADETVNQIALKTLEKKLADSTVTAPISGTVTAVYAKMGEPVSGAAPAFVVENVDDLVIKTKIKEYDVATIKEGMPAVIKSDATGESMFDGKVSYISPAAVKSADGSVQTSGGVEFSTDVHLVSKDTGLRVGMNVRLNVITAKIENVYAVPFDAVTMNEKGEKIVYIAKPGAEGKMIATAVPVTTGLETSFYIEISGDTLADGDAVINSPMGIVEGAEVTLIPHPAAMAGGAPAGDAASSTAG